MLQKYGFKNQKQRFKCMVCGYVFIFKAEISIEELWHNYQKGKQTYQQLAQQYGFSKRTIQRKLDKYEVHIPTKKARAVIVLMDTTYFGKSFGVMLFKDAITKQNLLKYYVITETKYFYKKGIDTLLIKGFNVLAIVCDGKKGLLTIYPDIPTQMCQFHQVAIIRRYLTKKPKLPASIELKAIVKLLKQTDKESFEGLLKDWHLKWNSFLNERTVNEKTGKSHFKHKKLRSAYRSLKTNLPYLFTWYDNIALNIPNTTNAIEGHFADLKNKMRNHNGLSFKRKKKFINGFLKA